MLFILESINSFFTKSILRPAGVNAALQSQNYYQPQSQCSYGQPQCGHGQCATGSCPQTPTYGYQSGGYGTAACSQGPYCTNGSCQQHGASYNPYASCYRPSGCGIAGYSASTYPSSRSAYPSYQSSYPSSQSAYPSYQSTARTGCPYASQSYYPSMACGSGRCPQGVNCKNGAACPYTGY